MLVAVFRDREANIGQVSQFSTPTTPQGPSGGDTKHKFSSRNEKVALRTTKRANSYSRRILLT
jgi:hypothetical protein